MFVFRVKMESRESQEKKKNPTGINEDQQHYNFTGGKKEPKLIHAHITRITI